MKSSDHQACFDALLKLNTSSINYVMKYQLHELSNHHCNHEEFQDNSKNVDKNEVFEAV